MKNKRTWIEIDPLAFYHNVTLYKKVIGTNKLAVVIKANAYGHGMHQIAALADAHTAVSTLCVATVSDALSLRNAGIKKSIITLSTIFDEDPIHLVGKNIVCSVYDMETIMNLNNIGKKHHFIFPIQLKIDTGLSRLGIDADTATDIIQYIKTLPHVSLEGIYSHLTESHKQDQSFTQEQIDRFAMVIDQLKKVAITISDIHIANSAGTTALDVPFCTLFRVGSGIYGLWPSKENQKITQEKYPDFQLKSIATWKTTIMSIKKVTKGSFIGYDRAFEAPHDMTIAILPIGYYDGYDFRLFNKASVMLNNEYAPIVGRISMNLCTIDITSIANAQIGDEVILMGPYPHIHPADLAHHAGNPNVREITTKINASIERVISAPHFLSLTPDATDKKKYTIPIVE